MERRKEMNVHAEWQISSPPIILGNIILEERRPFSGSSFVEKMTWKTHCSHTVRSTRLSTRRVMTIFRNLVIARYGYSLLKSCTTHATLLSMPPKRAASSSKRTAESESDSEKPVASKTTKKAKFDASPNLTEEGTGFAPNGQPTNKVLPIKISFPVRSEHATRIASWNICSLASSQKKVRFGTRSSWSSQNTDGCDSGFQVLCRG